MNMQMDEENKLIRKIQNGDLNSLRVIIDNYKRMAMSIAMKIIKHREDAEDAVQESFILVYRNIGKFNFSTKFSTWFYKIVLNQSLSVVRKSKPEFTAIDDDETLEEIPDSNFDFLEKENLEEIINSMINSLPELDSVILKLYYYENTGLDEIANIMEIKYSNAKVILHRARLKLKAGLLKKYSNEVMDWL